MNVFVIVCLFACLFGGRFGVGDRFTLLFVVAVLLVFSVFQVFVWRGRGCLAQFIYAMFVNN